MHTAALPGIALAAETAGAAVNTMTSSPVAIPRRARAWTVRDLYADLPAVPVGSRFFADFIWVAFVAAQAADGVFTYAGIQYFGLEIEANPIIAFSVREYGPGAILGAKGVAIVSAILLYTCGRHRTLGVLTIWYLLVAIWPWTLVLWP